MNDTQTEVNPILEQLSEILLVLDKELMRIQAVKGIGSNGELQTVEPTRENQSQFMRVDRHGDFFTNFFSNLFRQLKNPTRFKFFKVSENDVLKTADQLQQQVDRPTKEGEALMYRHEVDPKNIQKTENSMETTHTAPEQSEYRYQPEQIDWETMSNLGVSRERLEQRGLLDSLLRGYKTNELVAVNVNFGSAIIRSDARLSLQPGEDGKAVVAIHGIRRQPNLDFPFFGHAFTDEDKKNLSTTGNMGRVIDLTHPKTGEIMPSIISVDRLTNELVALRQDKMNIPNELFGAKLSDEQKQGLYEGKVVYVEGMISKKNTPFSANVQYNADKHYVELLFDRTNKQQQVQANAQNQLQEAPRVVRGKELSDGDYKKFNEGRTVYVTGLIDGKGKEYKGYLTFNKETGKTDFSFTNPNKLKDQVQTAEANKTQVAVNSEGKTNEATKNIDEPLKPQQQQPDNIKQQEQQQQQPPSKSNGMRR